ncbi:type I restriction endonuclease [Mucilaginibacter segetis]|uniref:Type I restriction enzyme HsdR N-terminal domain-containing protein n=1 Tax=Mucilaginibacter segetis TaxID=2793071 RepID=A0A934PXZ4_9SPHI|nr:type I restriction endonuclease [Mucilaginibacter segetis]MBK0381200.1 type I restriction enzyme HsdR N-terminal domain-containing protein [Mucilaginibacter segetis]
MDFKDQILQFASRVEKLCTQIQTEEATKNALIMPFIQLLGYDVFNPFEVNPEFVADIGIKKGEKVDYAIMNDGKPILLIECKHYTQDLNPHNSQLFRYFHTSEAKFGLLTNGIQFKFYTDLASPNKMDEKPFFEFKITDIKDNEIIELRKFHKSYFDVDNITNTASELKYLNQIKQALNQEFADPTDEFVKYFTKKVYPGAVTQKVLEQFKLITKRACSIYINDILNERFKSALEIDTNKEESLTPVIDSQKTDISDGNNIETTEDEIVGCLIIKSILSEKIDPKRVDLRDAQSYCAILLDDNNRKPICRLYFTEKKKTIAIINNNKEFVKTEITDLNELYQLKKQFFDALDLYL